MKKTVTLILIQISLILILFCLPRGQISLAHFSGTPDYSTITTPGETPISSPFQPYSNESTTHYSVLPFVSKAASIPSIAETPTETPTESPSPTPETRYTQDEGRTWEDYPGPSVWPDIDVPGPVGVLSHPDGQVNILLLGSDQRPYEGGFRTDTIQLITINPKEGSVKLTAFPRDLYVYIPGYTVERINTAMGWGGFEALAQTMEYNFGVKPDYYVLINFWSFKDVIDSLGGVEVNIGQDMCDQRDGFGWYCVTQSTTWMDGETALWYVRARYSTSDMDRGRRQQEVLQAIFEQLVSLDGLKRAPELYDIYKENVTTNLDINVLSSLLPIASHLSQAEQVGRYTIGESQVYDWTNSYGAMVLMPVREKVLQVMRQVISEP